MDAYLNSDCTFDEYLACFLTFLKQRNLRGTHERTVILKSVYESEKYFTIDSLMECLRQKKQYLSKTTLYGTLYLLLEAKFITKHHFFSSQSTQYEKLSSNETHNHIYMEDTKTIIEFSDSRIEEIIQDIGNQHNISPLRHSFIIYCDSKQEKYKQKK